MSLFSLNNVSNGRIFQVIYKTRGRDCVSCNISNTWNSVSSDMQTPRSALKNEAQPSFF